VRQGFTADNVLYRTLERFAGQVTWRALEPGREQPLVGPAGAPSGLAVEAVPLPGKPPVHLMGRYPPDPGDNVGFRIRELATGRVLAYLPGVAAVTPAVTTALRDAAGVFFDGTFWSDDELVAPGLGRQRAADMAHLPIGGPGGSLAALAAHRASRRVYIHINNTNPILREDSPERAAVVAAGWTVAHDGLELRL
jgi:pyrroloquinoline quinone biosynthesis protein B